MGSVTVRKRVCRPVGPQQCVFQPGAGIHVCVCQAAEGTLPWIRLLLRFDRVTSQAKRRILTMCHEQSCSQLWASIFFFFKWKVFVPVICNLLRFLRVHLSYSLLQPLQLIFSEAYNVGNYLVQFLFSLRFIHLEISFTARPQPLYLCHLSSPWHS